jgi:hypothetical protein
MRKTLWIIPTLLVIIGAPHARADSIDPPCFTTKPGEPFVLGTPGKKLTDSATLGQLCGYPGTLIFKVSGDAIFVPKEIKVDVKGVGQPGGGPGTYSVEGPVPEVADTFTWSVTYTPQGGKPSDPVFEKQVVTKKARPTPEPGTLALMLLGVGVLLVTRKGLGKGRPEAT